MGYLAAGRLMHDRAVEKALQLVDRSKVLRADAYPSIGTIFLWRAVVETSDDWLAVRVHYCSRDPVRKYKFTRVAKVEPNVWIRRARRLREYEVYEWFTCGRLRAEYANVNGLHVVRFHDMRYAWPLESVESLWTVSVILDDAGRLPNRQ